MGVQDNKKGEIEEGLIFQPKFDASGLMPCVTICGETGKVLMVAYMNALALRKTLETREAHYWSRSRGELWHKGATSGQKQSVVSIRTDCDQDCLVMAVQMPNDQQAGNSCHTGRKSCFYREIIQTGSAAEPVQLRFIDD